MYVCLYVLQVFISADVLTCPDIWTVHLDCTFGLYIWTVYLDCIFMYMLTVHVNIDDKSAVEYRLNIISGHKCNRMEEQKRMS